MTSLKQQVECAIIAGGKSSRFGSNKALAPWIGKMQVIQAVMVALSVISDKVSIISPHAAPYAHLKLPVYPDIFQGFGPLSGIHSALRHSDRERVLIVACDMPALSSELLEYLISAAPWAPVTVPESDSGLEPLHAVWHTSLIPVLEQFMAAKQTGLRSILNILPCRIITAEEMAHRGFSTMGLKSTNTPESLATLKQRWLDGPA